MADQFDMPLATIRTSDPRHRELWDIVIFLDAATKPLLKDASDPAQAMSMLMTAAAHFAGGILGKLIVAGVASDRDKRRAVEAMAANFRAGIDVGKRAAMRTVKADCEGSA
ncbi:hypothetical protein [Rhizorhabdus histidinilytica]|uniref:hypothetical protein n=1 Tax=Rhizorhabdus histidinilytica TaxID=439228 RepID=UPI00063F0E5F|nr:hypothetical protein [Sphingomonas sp. Y57]